jgi:AcrR family transcriptional regulator
MQNEETAVDSARRDQILAAARAALTKVGFEKITTRRIAEEAGVNIATLHYHFGSKEALLTEAVRDAARRFAGTLRAAMDGAGEAADALERVFAATWQVVRERPGVIRYDLAVRGFRDEAARQDALAIYGGYQAILVDIAEKHVAAGGAISGGLTPGQFADYVLACADGVILQHLLSGDDGAARRGLDLTKRHALQLLGLDGTTEVSTEDDDRTTADDR